jgi:aryl-alcohol dehydrogenase-like predicted oxidoreductase
MPLTHALLGSTGISVSPIGLGTVKFGRSSGVKYPTPVSVPDDAAAAHLLDRAMSLGINLIDTAPAYGTSESRLGGLLKGQRDRWVICTKVGETFENDQSTFDFSPRAIVGSVERSLQRLATDRLDIVLVHSDGVIEADLIGSKVLPSLAALRQQGKIRAIGASTKTVEGALAALPHCDVLMLTLHPNHLDELPVIEAARLLGKGVLIKKVFGSGHLAGASQRACLDLALGTPGVGSVIIGTTNPQHLESNVQLAAASLARGIR